LLGSSDHPSAAVESTPAAAATKISDEPLAFTSERFPAGRLLPRGHQRVSSREISTNPAALSDRIQVSCMSPDNIAARRLFLYRCTATEELCGTRLATLR